jgi:hypothetical protein
MGGITGSSSVSVGAGLSGNGTPASPLTNSGVLSAGNGLSGTNPIAVAAPTFNTVGSNVNGTMTIYPSSISSGQNFAAGAAFNQVQSSYSNAAGLTNNLSGTWKWLGAPVASGPCGTVVAGVFCRVA